MTTFHELPANSRRAARQSERGELTNPITTVPGGGNRPSGYPQQNYPSQNPPAPSYPAPSHQNPSYQNPGYQAQTPQAQAPQAQPPQPSGYPTLSYPTPHYPAPSYQAQSYQAQSSQSPSYPAPSSSSQSQPFQPQSYQPYESQPQQPYLPQSYQPQSYQPQQSYKLPQSYQPQQSYQSPQSLSQPYLPTYSPPAPQQQVAPSALGGLPDERTLSRREVRAIHEQRDSGVIDFGNQQVEQHTAPQVSDPQRSSEPVVEVKLEQSFAATTGHWSRQAALDDAEQPFSAMLTREVGRGNVTTATNALILPTTASSPNDFAAAINSTGEIIVTGSITLPGSVARGVQDQRRHDQRRYDHPDIDSLFDASDHEVIGTNSAPIRAIRSVSSQTSTHGIIRANKPHGNRMLVFLLVAASIMAVGVAGLLVAGFIFKIF